ncbi:hypothetical protein [Arthrobacter sp. A2-55]|uniref:hypothetical protein n=1 Tax=Arthrobacter sp. A2-55 TaxID=2897337 RepID=UPI0021CD8E4E|nr:hypothetical protein [Arthrobacter sp. A2-55]MCU6481318.1 hypothetical protein [Arthrobacter sp. A2-55]
MDLSSFPADRLVLPEKAPAGALMLTSLGHVAVIASTISAYFPGDDEPRLLWDYQAGGQWAILASDLHNLMMPQHATSATGRPSLRQDLEGVDAEGHPVAWMETNRPDYWNNTWEWFTIQREEPLSDDEVAYPVSAWVA